MEQKVARDGMLVADEVLACSIKLDDEEVLAVAADVVLEVQFNFVVIVKEEGKSPHRSGLSTRCPTHQPSAAPIRLTSIKSPT